VNVSREPSADLRLALELADLADELSLSRFRALDLKVDTKPDLSPVTEADKAIERALRERIAEARPEDAVLGEEEGASGEGPRRWILDPIDGTRNYSRGIPIFGTLIALEVDGELTIGVASAPALGRRWWAERGHGAFADGQPIRVSQIATIEEAVLSGLGDGFGEAEAKLAARSWHGRGFGEFWQYMLVAEGSADIGLDPIVNLWDLAAPLVIVEEAGGTFTDLKGERRADGGSALATNGVLHDAVLDALG
jgi:histidinol-phosphatase